MNSAWNLTSFSREKEKPSVTFPRKRKGLRKRRKELAWLWNGIGRRNPPMDLRALHHGHRWSWPRPCFRSAFFSFSMFFCFSIYTYAQNFNLVFCMSNENRSNGVRMLVLCSLVWEDSLLFEFCRFSFILQCPFLYSFLALI